MSEPVKKQMARFISRQLLGTTLRAVSLQTNIPFNTLSRLRAGKKEILSRTIDEVRTGFRCTLQDIFPDEYRPPTSNRPGLKPNPIPRPVWTPFREDEFPPIRPVMAFLSFMFAQIGLFCRPIKLIASRNKVIAA